ncbi:hypothetical protein IQ247_16950 [Plectonema cf. radiosum LEGE 06105]|uniref:Uncharacterized protein n=1 Tax=Plectonema cf. radiosum LEGE 06105 TaxID=945769 RepID=A0A8J7K116_9CYAN|nr:hypothetical protein [Plectonema radiosum]MBE9214336.1 hypothetical protein [Plectonema cf. radiosum LEGE 06105]
MVNTISYPNAPDLAPDDYIVIGLATCFIKEEGEVHQVDVIEPIPSASLESLFKGIPTSYKSAVATTLGSVLDGETARKPPELDNSAQIVDDFSERAFAAARTYKRKESAQSLIPLGGTYSDFQYSVEKKRVLNAQRVVNKDDNVKQHSHTHKIL